MRLLAAGRGPALITAGLGLVLGWSMLTETLLPLWRRQAYLELALNCLGLPLFLVGAAAFLWGGLVFWRHTAALTNEDEGFAERAIRLRDPDLDSPGRRDLQRRQLAVFWRTWRPGLAWLAAGFGLIAAGSLLINWLPRWLE